MNNVCFSAVDAFESVTSESHQWQAWIFLCKLLKRVSEMGRWPGYFGALQRNEYMNLPATTGSHTVENIGEWVGSGGSLLPGGWLTNIRCLPYRIMAKAFSGYNICLEVTNCSEIWQAARQHCCRAACQISKQCVDLNINFAAAWLDYIRFYKRKPWHLVTIVVVPSQIPVGLLRSQADFWPFYVRHIYYT